MSFGKDLLRLHETRRSARNRLEQQWEDLLRIGRPSQRSFLNRSTQPHQKDSEDIFDNTGMMAAEDLASTIFVSTTDPAQQWLRLTLKDPEEADKLENRIWLNTVSKILLANFANNASNFYSSGLEALIDTVWYGTGIESSNVDTEKKIVSFRSWSLSNTFLDENENGEIDSVDRVFLLTQRQVMQMFNRKDDYIPPGLARQLKNQDANLRLEFVEFVFPRKEYQKGRTDKRNRPYQSVIVFKETGDIIREDGYFDFPFHVSRWTKEAGDVYGYGPGLKALPTIRQLQTAKKEWIAAIEVANRPPLIVEDDSVLDGIGLGAGHINISNNPLSQGMPIVPINLGTVPQQAWQAILDLRNEVNAFFYNDATQIAKKRERQTESEVLILQQEQLRKLRAVVGRIEREGISKKIIATYNGLNRMGLIPPAPPDIKSHLEIVYENAAARTQKQQGIRERAEFMNRVGAYAQFDPSVAKALNSHEILRLDALESDQPPSIIKSKEEMEAEMQAAQQQQQMQMMVENAGGLAKGMKDLSEANLLPTQ